MMMHAATRFITRRKPTMALFMRLSFMPYQHGQKYGCSTLQPFRRRRDLLLRAAQARHDISFEPFLH